ncbi:hypothetical protein [Nocardia sp. CDC160]|uniref:hypothetical protein n=1 Tax=Nocardia sp. CDC160 TaxID=3112166 RepID=UPI002DBA8585|nr:hypothetical protein [Nocardia sp. CDC160]MEC3913323.1 hypothetical protein [Nocardia sp. CDC160]
MTDQVDNPWDDLSRQAHGGGLQIDDGIAKEAAGYAADVVYALQQAKKNTKPLTEYTGFSDNNMLQSALNLMDRYKTQGKAVDGIIDHYITLLSSMADTLLAAGNTYNRTDDHSKTAFNALLAAAKDHVTVVPLPTGDTSFPQWTDTPTAPDDTNFAHMKAVAQAKNGRYPDAIGSEDPGSHRGKWFFDVRDGIHAVAVTNSSGAWKSLADTVDGSFETLTERMKRIQESGSWSGHGMDAAMSATGRFVAEASAFTTDLQAMAESIAYFGNTLLHTVIAMDLPAAWDPSWANTDTETQYANQGKAAFTSWYIPGLAYASTSVPQLHDPTTPPTQDPSWHPRSDYRGSGPGDRSGGPHGSISPSGPGSHGGSDGKKPGGKNDPKGAHPGKGDPRDKGHHDPKDKDGKDHGGKDPNGKNPEGKNPNGSNPDDTGSNSSNQSSSSNSGQSSAMSGLQSALQSLTSSASQNTDQKKSQDLKDALKDSPLTNLLDDLKKPLGGSPGGGGPGGSPTKPLSEVANARLFPRAAVAEVAEGNIAGVARAGIASSSPTSGMGGGMGGMGHGGGGAHGAQGKEHKRPDFLDSNEHLDEAMGTAPIVAKPVVEG